mgnify:CR=1 FL=1
MVASYCNTKENGAAILLSNDIDASIINKQIKETLLCPVWKISFKKLDNQDYNIVIYDSLTNSFYYVPVTEPEYYFIPQITIIAKNIAISCMLTDIEQETKLHTVTFREASSIYISSYKNISVPLSEDKPINFIKLMEFSDKNIEANFNTVQGSIQYYSEPIASKPISGFIAFALIKKSISKQDVLSNIELSLPSELFMINKTIKSMNPTNLEEYFVMLKKTKKEKEDVVIHIPRGSWGQKVYAKTLEYINAMDIKILKKELELQKYKAYYQSGFSDFMGSLRTQEDVLNLILNKISFLTEKNTSNDQIRRLKDLTVSSLKENLNTQLRATKAFYNSGFISRKEVNAVENKLKNFNSRTGTATQKK